MNIHQAFQNIEAFGIRGPQPVLRTAAEAFRNRIRNPSIPVRSCDTAELEPGVFRIAIGAESAHGLLKDHGRRAPGGSYILMKIREDGSGVLIASESFFLYGFISYAFDHIADEDVSDYAEGKFFKPAFDWQRISYDFFLTQEGRIQEGLDRESYIRELARLGFTHVEVNGLAFPHGLETGPKGEAYPMFYTYCPALDQFVSSKLNKGLYPRRYLKKNLDYLKTNAAWARKYGLTPGLLCFEPRSVPEKFFRKYPMLRGARVDHPFRSFKPRYNMTIAHPLVREHYAEMLQALMREVPDLGFMAVWTNDSGAGFEHTQSLYVGRNGGPYLIREWKDNGEIARAAGENAVRFFRVLRDAARRINPDFRILTRLESFYGEHETVWDGLGDGFDVEAHSLMTRGWNMPYTHPKYTESSEINGGTVYQMAFDPKEKEKMRELEQRNARVHFYTSAGPHTLFAPLLGIPYPFLTHRRMKMLHENGVRWLGHCGGTHPPNLVPFNINHEVTRAFQFDPGMDIENVIAGIAAKWTGEASRQSLIDAWKLTEDAILSFPVVTPLYATFGFTWYRLWLRPLVPDIAAVPEKERAYYEDNMCTTPHNPNNIDLSRDVLFRLTTSEKSRLDAERIDKHLRDPMDRAIEILRTVLDASTETRDGSNVIYDQWVRLRALRCWFMTQRNVAAWIADVYEYIEAGSEAEKNRLRASVRSTVRQEIENTEQLSDCLATHVRFMAMTDRKETPLMHGSNMKRLLRRRIALMERHIGDEPRIESMYIEKMAGQPVR